jgi:inhibitor of KinA sporulation pathway (predicted exonuclease)
MRLFGADVLVVFDTEWTTWEGAMQRNWSGPGEHMEVVQIGAIRIDPVTLDEVDALEILVRPRINPRLSDYFIDLTGVPQSRVDAEGVDLVPAVERFGAFLPPGGVAISNGGDDDILTANAALYGLPRPLTDRRFVNLRPILMERTGRARHELVSGDLHTTLGFSADHPAHDALGDARNVAESLRHLKSLGRLGGL